jgi:uncharacterized membrane protein YccC
MLFGLRLAASVCLALLIAFWLQLDNPYWAGTSAGIVAQPALGASLRKGRFRAIGTVIGGVSIVVLTAVFPQNHLALLCGLAVWGAACGFFATILPNFGGYAAALAGYTTAIVFGDLVADPQNVFMQAVWRVTEIAIGILSAELVHALTDFGHARARLARLLADTGRDIASGLMQTLRTGHDPSEVRTLRRELIRRVIALDAIIDEAVGEPSHLRHQAAPLRAAQEALFVALSAWCGIANHLWAMPHQEANAIAAELLPRIAKLARASWLEDPQGVRQICREETQVAGGLATADVSSRLIQEGTIRTLRALEGVADALVLASISVSRSSSQQSSRSQVPDFLPPILNGLRILVALLIAELFWIVTEWPDGPTLITFTAVSVILFSLRADTAFSSAVEFAVGCAGASVVAVILNQAILPVVPSDFRIAARRMGCNFRSDRLAGAAGRHDNFIGGPHRRHCHRSVYRCGGKPGWGSPQHQCRVANRRRRRGMRNDRTRETASSSMYVDGAYRAVDNTVRRADPHRGSLSGERGHSRRCDWRCVSLVS